MIFRIKDIWTSLTKIPYTIIGITGTIVLVYFDSVGNMSIIKEKQIFVKKTDITNTLGVADFNNNLEFFDLIILNDTNISKEPHVERYKKLSKLDISLKTIYTDIVKGLQNLLTEDIAGLYFYKSIFYL